MFSKSIHHTSNKKFLAFRQLSKQNHQIEICEASNFLNHFGIGSLQTNFFKVFVSLKLQEMRIFGNMKFSWKK